jgi:hypothetical protein
MNEAAVAVSNLLPEKEYKMEMEIKKILITKFEKIM